MSWLPRSIANTLRLDEDEDAAEETNPGNVIPRPKPKDAVPPEDRPLESTLFGAQDCRLSDSKGDASHSRAEDEDPDVLKSQARGVKEDLSEFRDSLRRQFWGVASFLAPPPLRPPVCPGPGSLHSETESDREDKKDEELAEYESRETGQFAEPAHFSPSEDYYPDIVEEAVGITDEVLAFARNIAHHPETWLDFPLSEEEDFDDFFISDAQYRHALAIEHLAPRLAALRTELCPVHMREGYFWMVYFVLLHSRLNKHDADLLSTTQIVQVRAMWMQELQKQIKEDSYGLGTSTPRVPESTDSPRKNFMMHTYDDACFRNLADQISAFKSSMHQLTAEHETEKCLVNEIEFIDKSVIREDPAPTLEEKEMIVGSSFEKPVQYDNDDDDDDGWLKEDSELIGYSGPSVVVNEEDIIV